MGPPSEELVRAHMASVGAEWSAAVEQLEEYAAKCEYWINDTYQVELSQIANVEDMVQLCIRRRDGGPILRDWRHFQWIKNQLVGEECEAIELYPAESRLVDTNNKYHLWAVKDPTFRFPVGWITRDVDYATGKARGLKQRPL